MMASAAKTACSTCASSLLVAGLIGCALSEVPQVATHVGDWRDEIIYQIVVDRFDNGDPDNDWVAGVGPEPGDLRRHQGGDWRGIGDRLDYIERLGVTTIWISPIVANVDRTDRQDGYHGYWAADFTAANPRFGSASELRELVDRAHERDIKVIVDVVTNHTGNLFFYDVDGDGVFDDGESEPGFADAGPYDAAIEWSSPPPSVFTYRDGIAETIALGEEHFHRRGRINDQRDQHQKELGDFPTGLRDLDTERADVVTAMVDTVVRWVELSDVDGIRLDAVPHVAHAFWRDFSYRLRARLAAIGKHRFILLGEVFDPDPEILAAYTGRGGLDSVFDFSLKHDVIEGFILDGEPAASTVAALEDYRAYYPTLAHEHGVDLSPWQARVAFADNHDVPRLRYWLDDPFAAELAMTVVFTVDAIPAVYYGTEQELDGGWGDDAREVMWETGFREDTRMFRHLARLAEIRRRSSALRRGALIVRYASRVSAHTSAADAGLLAYERVHGDERALVVLSGHPIDHAEARVPTGFADGSELVDALSGRRLTVTAGAVDVRIPPRGAMILEAAE